MKKKLFLFFTLLFIQPALYGKEEIPSFKLNYREKFDELIELVQDGIEYKEEDEFAKATSVFNEVITTIDDIIVSIAAENEQPEESTVSLDVVNDIKFMNVQKECLDRLDKAKNLYIVGLYNEAYDSLYIVQQILKKTLQWVNSVPVKRTAYVKGVRYEAKNTLAISNNLKITIKKPQRQWISGPAVTFSGTAQDSFGRITGIYFSSREKHFSLISKISNWAVTVPLPRTADTLDVYFVVSNDFRMMLTNHLKKKIDHTPPVLKLLSPADQSSLKEYTEFKGIVYDNEAPVKKFYYQVNNGPQRPLLIESNWHFTLNPVYYDQNGSMELALYAENRAGLTTAVKKRYSLSQLSSVRQAKTGTVTNYINLTNYYTNTVTNIVFETNYTERTITPATVKAPAKKKSGLSPAMVFFKKNSSLLSSNAVAKLRYIAALLKKSSFKKIIVTGHTDTSGSEILNMRLAYARAREVKIFLLKEKIKTGKIIIRAAAASRPLFSNHTARGRSLNRRVEIQIIK